MMKTIQFTKAFAFSPNGTAVVEYQAGDIVEVDDECAEIAISVEKAVEVTGDALAAAIATRAALVEKLEAQADKLEADASALDQKAATARVKAEAARLAAKAARVSADSAPQLAAVATDDTVQ